MRSAHICNLPLLQIVSDLSDQLKDSEERIQDLLVESEGARLLGKDKEREHEENISRIIMAMDGKYKDTMKMQQEQLNTESAKVSKLETELYMRRNLRSKSTVAAAEAAASPTESSGEDMHAVYEELCGRLQSSMEQVRISRKGVVDG